MREHFEKPFKLSMLGMSTMLLVACGGGGGGGAMPGGNGNGEENTSNKPFEINFTSDKSFLALNIQNDAPVNGGPYTALLNVRSNYVPSSLEAGGNCWAADFTVISGFPSVRLYDGGLEFGDQPVYSSFKAVSSTGNWNVALNATDVQGTAVIEVAVPDPNTSSVRCNDDKIEYSQRYANIPMSFVRKQYTVQVGAPATGKPAQIVLNKSTSNFLYLQGKNDPTSMVVQARLIDESGQPVNNPGANNMVARITNVGNTGAYLQSGGVTGTEVRAASINGQAQFMLHSGNTPATLLLEVRADRADNNVDNGISDTVYNVATVPLVAANPNPNNTPLAITTPAVTALCRNQANSIALQAAGGTLPYSWYLQANQNLPAGLTFKDDGSFGGTATVAAGTQFQINVGVRDSAFPTKGEDSDSIAFTVIDPPTLQFSGDTVSVSSNSADAAKLGTGRWTWEPKDTVTAVPASDGQSVKFTSQAPYSVGIYTDADNNPATPTVLTSCRQADVSVEATVTFDGGCESSIAFTLKGEDTKAPVNGACE